MFNEPISPNPPKRNRSRSLSHQKYTKESPSGCSLLDGDQCRKLVIAIKLHGAFTVESAVKRYMGCVSFGIRRWHPNTTLSFHECLFKLPASTSDEQMQAIQAEMDAIIDAEQVRAK